jgi:hypothetical protein
MHALGVPGCQGVRLLLRCVPVGWRLALPASLSAQTALSETTLAAPMTASQTSIQVASATGAVAGGEPEVLGCGANLRLAVNQVAAFVDDASGLSLFREIIREDITAKGKIVPVGARHFAERARRVQNLQQLYQLKLQDPSVAAHMSGKEFARILAEELGEKTLFSENVMVTEQLETQQAAQEAEMLNAEQLAIKEQMGI